MRDRLIGGLLLGVLVAATGCASRGWVQEIEGRVQQFAQRQETDGKRLDAEARRLDVETRRVDALGQRMDELDARMGQLVRHHHAATVVDTVDILFRFGRADLDDNAMTRLHALARELREDHRLGAELVGFTDARGGRDFNLTLSQRRVDAVRRYLVQQGVPVSRVAAIGLGALAEAGVADAQKRRVTVQVTMPETYVMTPPSAQADAPTAAATAQSN